MGSSRYEYPPSWQDDVKAMAKEHFAEHDKCITAAPAWRLLQQRAKDYDLWYIQQVVGEAGDKCAHLEWLEWDGKPRQPISFRRFKDFLELVNRSLREADNDPDVPMVTRWRGVLG